jgi:hypothetical protein
VISQALMGWMAGPNHGFGMALRRGTISSGTALRYWAHMAMPMASEAPTMMSWQRVSVPS